MAKTVNCVILKKECEGLDYPPVPGDLGQKIFESVSKEAWAQWTAQQTMIINEYRLNLADPRAQQMLTDAMEQALLRRRHRAAGRLGRAREARGLAQRRTTTRAVAASSPTTNRAKYTPGATTPPSRSRASHATECRPGIAAPSNSRLTSRPSRRGSRGARNAPPRPPAPTDGSPVAPIPNRARRP